jgi:hypothetical protein
VPLINFFAHRALTLWFMSSQATTIA